MSPEAFEKQTEHSPGALTPPGTGIETPPEPPAPLIAPRYSKLWYLLAGALGVLVVTVLALWRLSGQRLPVPSLFDRGTGDRLREIISDFELAPKIADGAGIAPHTTFILKSSADLEAPAVTKHLRIEPATAFEVRKIGSGSSIFEITPKSALAENTIYTVSIAEGPLAARIYSWAYQVKAPFRLETSIPRNRATSVPPNTAIELTFSRERLLDPERFVEITPPVPGRFETRRNVLTFIPGQPLKPKTVYTLTVKAGLRSEESQDVLGGPATVSFETTEGATRTAPTALSFDKLFWEFKPGSEPTLQVGYGGVQAPRVAAAVYRLGDAGEFIASYQAAYPPEHNWTRFQRLKPLELPPNRRVLSAELPVEEQVGVRFLRLPQRFEEGFYILEATIGEERSRAWFQVTPLASFLALSGTKTLLWLKDAPSATAAAGAEVSLGTTLLAKTASDGVALFETPPELTAKPDEAPSYSAIAALLLVKHGTRTLVLPAENDYGYATKISPPDAWWDYLALDKNVYLPSDTIRFWGVVKRRNLQELRGTEIVVELTKPYWENTPAEKITSYGSAKLAVSDFYTITGQIPFRDLKPGLYQLSVRHGQELIASETVNVEAYVKPAWRITLETDRNAVFAGDAITWRARATFFDGTPLRHLRLRYAAYWHENVGGEVETNDEGEAVFRVATDYREDSRDYWPRYLGVTVSPALAEEGEITAHRSVLVFGPRLALELDQRAGREASVFNLTLRNIVLDRAGEGRPIWQADAYLGEPPEPWPIEVDIAELVHRRTEIERRYDPIDKLTYPVYRYETEERPVSRAALSTDRNGRATFEWRAPERKTYRLSFTTRDRTGRLVKRQGYVYGAPLSHFEEFDPRGAWLKNLDDKEEYGVGEPFHLQMQDAGGNVFAPSPGRFLFLRITNGISSYRVADSPDETDRFSDVYIPNVSIIGVWLGTARFYSTYQANLSFRADERRLHIEVQKDKERYRPRDKVKLAIRVTDKDKKPKQAEVNVSAIDEAVFSLNPDEKDFLNDLYRDDFPFIVTRSSHLSPLEQGAEKGGCFVSGTSVLTPSGPRSIEELRVGDEVLGRASPDSPAEVRTRVRRIGAHLGDGYLVINETLRITANHRLWVNDRWQRAGEVEIGDRLQTPDGTAKIVRSIAKHREWLRVYNIELEAFHVYFADGILVHNEEKGGGARTDFRDSALHQSVRTDERGQAVLEFNVPDNLTSWRVTIQAFSKDLFAGKVAHFVPVGLPFSLDATLNKSYLTGDTLLARLRTSGTANVTDNIAYTVESETLPFKKIEQRGSGSTEVPLGRLPAGKHRITFTARAGEHRDAIARELTVLDSYFSRTTAAFYELGADLGNIKSSEKGLTTLLFASAERGRFYPALNAMARGSGARLDQKIAGTLAKRYLGTFFGDGTDTAAIDARSYQTPKGGLALLPYGGDDLALSAKFAHLASGEQRLDFGREALRGYFAGVLNDRQTDLRRAALALYGLAAFREPILTTIQGLKDDRNLALPDKIHLALALEELGAKEEARGYYRSAIKPSLARRPPFISAPIAESQDETILASALLAALSASLEEGEAEGLGRYAMEMTPKETLKNLELLLYLKATLPRLKSGTVGFTYQTGARSGSPQLRESEIFRLELSREELATLRFSNVNGHIAMVSRFEEHTTPETLSRDRNLELSRSYSVNGRQTTAFRDGDLVRVELTPRYAPGALEGAYQLTDHLPSGLRTSSGLQQVPYETGERFRTHPVGIEDQRVTFVVSPRQSPPIVYYARVVSKGTFRAEGALLQSTKSLESLAISASQTITIE